MSERLTKDCTHKLHTGDRNVPLSEFPKNTAREDGHHLYCKACCRMATQQARGAVRRRAQERLNPAQLSLPLTSATPARKQSKVAVARISPATKVYRRIIAGSCTQKQIQADTKLPLDVIGDALCELFDERLIGSRVIAADRRDITRLYFATTPSEKGESRDRRGEREYAITAAIALGLAKAA